MFVVSFRGRSRAFSPEELRPLRRAVRRPRRDGSLVVSGWLGSYINCGARRLQRRRRRRCADDQYKLYNDIVSEQYIPTHFTHLHI